ncbi:MAG TPA: hypothetical protein DFS52_14195 [Myxococcales bacterium]|nr:hypothetical protein [Myxococcales bacterium]
MDVGNAMRSRASLRGYWSLLCVLLAASSGGCAVFLPPTLAPAPESLPLAADIEAGAPLTARWIGHSTVVLRLGGVEVVTDPFLRGHLVGMRRQRPAGLREGELPRPEVVLVSHLHYDHCDLASLRALARPEATLVLPKGGARRLPPLGFGRVVELEPWESARVGGLNVVAFPVDHFGGRTGADAWLDRTFRGYVLEAEGQRVVFTGDTGLLTDWAAQVGERFPNADLALIPIGPYRGDGVDSPVHVGPSSALQILQDLRAKRMIPIHFESFFGFSTGEEPGAPRRRLRARAAQRGLAEVVWDLEVGESLAVWADRVRRLSSEAARAVERGAQQASLQVSTPAGAEDQRAGEGARSLFGAAGPAGLLLSRALPSLMLRLEDGGELSAGVAWELEPLTLTLRTLAGPQLHLLGAPLATRAAGSIGLHFAGGVGASPVVGRSLWGAAELRAVGGGEDLSATVGAG